MDKGYPKFAKALNKTGRPIVFSCSWPAYQVFMGMKVCITLFLTMKVLFKKWFAPI